MLSHIAQSTSRRGGARFRCGFFNIYLGLAGAAHRAAVIRHIDRYAPDIMGLSEINSGDRTYLTDTLGPAVGLDNVVLGDDASLQPALMTRFPVLDSGVLSSPEGANEFLRKPVWAMIDVGSSKNIVVYVCHTESFCYSAPCADVIRDELEFARAIEWQRLANDIQSRLSAIPNLEFLVIGDMNDDPFSMQSESFASQPSGVWSGFSLGGDITFPVQYARYPEYQCEQAGLQLVKAKDIDGSRMTLWSSGEGGPNPAISIPYQIDYLCHSDGIGVFGHEVVSSEATQTGGMTKYGSPLPSGDSFVASDHKMVVGDFRIYN